ncbi:MAG: DUF2442 domain-containing protein [Tepidisphaeraceae bacterium]|jgi:hypothetical protein
MSILEIKVEPFAVDVSFAADDLIMRLADGRQVSVPLAWFPRLLQATSEQRGNWRLIGNGIGVHWPLIDEDVSVATVLSAE